jgi:hypothetical protein
MKQNKQPPLITVMRVGRKLIIRGNIAFKAAIPIALASGLLISLVVGYLKLASAT